MLSGRAFRAQLVTQGQRELYVELLEVASAGEGRELMDDHFVEHHAEVASLCLAGQCLPAPILLLRRQHVGMLPADWQCGLGTLVGMHAMLRCHLALYAGQYAWAVRLAPCVCG